MSKRKSNFHNPILIKKTPKNPLVYNQNVTLKFLKPPPLSPTGNLYVSFAPDIQMPERKPKHVKHRPHTPFKPRTKIIREAPPEPGKRNKMPNCLFNLFCLCHMLKEMYLFLIFRWAITLGVARRTRQNQVPTTASSHSWKTTLVSECSAHSHLRTLAGLSSTSETSRLRQATTSAQNNTAQIRCPHYMGESRHYGD